MMKPNEIKSILLQYDLVQLEEMSTYVLEAIMNRQNEENKEYSCGEIICPKCLSNNYIKYGKVRNKQRFLCRDCEKTFGMNSDR